jgi:hypothetical protein
MTKRHGTAMICVCGVEPPIDLLASSVGLQAHHLTHPTRQADKVVDAPTRFSDGNRAD